MILKQYYLKQVNYIKIIYIIKKFIKISFNK